jgi:hypothetical protein
MICPEDWGSFFSETSVNYQTALLDSTKHILKLPVFTEEVWHKSACHCVVKGKGEAQV